MLATITKTAVARPKSGWAGPDSGSESARAMVRSGNRGRPRSVLVAEPLADVIAEPFPAWWRRCRSDTAERLGAGDQVVLVRDHARSELVVERTLVPEGI